LQDGLKGRMLAGGTKDEGRRGESGAPGQAVAPWPSWLVRGWIALAYRCHPAMKAFNLRLDLGAQGEYLSRQIAAQSGDVLAQLSSLSGCFGADRRNLFLQFCSNF